MAAIVNDPDDHHIGRRNEGVISTPTYTNCLTIPGAAQLHECTTASRAV